MRDRPGLSLRAYLDLVFKIRIAQYQFLVKSGTDIVLYVVIDMMPKELYVIR